MIPLPKKHIISLNPYSPGKPIEEVKRELGLKKVIKMASNENPLGPSPLALKAAYKALKKVHLYPESGSYYLCRKLAASLNVKPENICLGNGSNELILLAIHSYASEPEDRIAYGFPSFIIYRIIAHSYGIKTIETGLRNHRIDLEKLAGSLTEHTKIVFLCNPNNPMGTMNHRNEVAAFIEKVPSNVLTVMDEAYCEYADKKTFPDLVKISTEKPNLVILRTFSKMYGLAGLRIGYAIGHKSIIETLNKARQPFNVNSIAQSAALAALDDLKHVKRTLETNAEGIDYIVSNLRRMGVEFIPTSTNFILIKTGDSKKFFDMLLEKGIIVRPMGSYGLNEYIRVTVGLPSENRNFIRNLEVVMSLTGGNK
ncbi:MAG: histidinol-phosphate transaminase [Candidatus Aureabacteria bacterium]|nr:histidinol-phosphate transaminase [Candidatus Auribacterota bacterium]